MSLVSRGTVVGVGLGVAAAGLAGVAGATAERLWRDREQAIALGTDADFTVQPTHTLVVVADDGVPLHVEIDEPEQLDDSRPTVVLSHGYTLDLRSWVFQRRALRQAGYRVVAWDQRGHGSSGVGDPAAYTVDRLGWDLRQVIADSTPSGDLVLVGHSMGGMTVMALAEEDPALIRERVLGVGLISTSAGGLNRVTWGLGPMLGGVINRVGPVAMGKLAGRQDIVDAALRGGRDLPDLVVARSAFASPVPLAVVRLAGDMIFCSMLEVMAAYGPGLTRHDKVEALAQLDGVEVLVLNGAKDVLTSPLHSDEIVDHLPHAEHVVVQDAGHIIMLEHPSVVSSQLLDLVHRAERARPPKNVRSRGQRREVTDLEHRRRTDRARPRRTRPRGKAG